MAFITRPPLVDCDLCDKQAEARLNNQDQWVKPASWGKINFENKPTDVKYADLCDECCAAFYAVLAPVIVARKKP
jgi:hypothetical protein